MSAGVSISSAEVKWVKFERGSGEVRSLMNDLQTVFQLTERALRERPLRHFAPISGVNGLNFLVNKAMIACTARSGSTLLSACLERYGLEFYEYLNSHGYIKDLVEHRGVSSFEELGNHLAEHAIGNGYFAVKTAYEDLPVLLYLGEMPLRLERWKIIFLQRKNSVRQAISMLIARKSGQWTYDMKAQAEVSDADYSFSDISRYVDYISTTNGRWERFFSLFRVEPHRIFYEDLASDMAEQVEAIGRFLGVDVAAFPKARLHKPRLESQSSDLKRQWEQRFREELGEVASRAAQRPQQGEVSAAFLSQT